MNNKYFVSADVHGYYTEYRKALKKAGFDFDNPSHYLVLLGDMLDRGKEARKMVDFCTKMLKKGRLLYVKGNHDTLLFDLLKDLKNPEDGIPPHHFSNGTLDTVCQFANISVWDVLSGSFSYKEITENSYIKRFKNIINNSFDYLETDKHIFVHGYIPCELENGVYKKISDWRNCEKEKWEKARWINGIAAWRDGVREEGKDIVVGHWHCSALWAELYPDKYVAFSHDSDEKERFDICKADGIIALDGCTAYSGIVNVLVLEEGEF